MKLNWNFQMHVTFGKIPFFGDGMNIFGSTQHVFHVLTSVDIDDMNFPLNVMVILQRVNENGQQQFRL